MKITEVIKPTRLRMGVERLLAAAQEMTDWRNWYIEHEDLIEELFGDDAKLFRSLLAATSQLSSVTTNVPLALKAYQQLKRGEPFTGYMPQVIRNLDRIRDNQSLSGLKISQFGGAMENGADNVAIDQHIGDLFFGNPKPTPPQVRKAKIVIAKIAGKLGWQPREVQAALWAYNKMRHGQKIHTYQSVLDQHREKVMAVVQALNALKQEQAA
jgi:hypothetical protein